MAPIWRWLRAKAGHPIVDLHFADLTIVLYEQSQEEFLELRHWTRLSAIFFGPANQRAHIEALARGTTPNSFKEWRAEPEPDEAREVFGLLRQAGSPVRPANVEGVLDTASGGYLLEVTVHENGQAWHSEVSLQYRGFRRWTTSRSLP